jgi:hypothetical protein
MPNTTTTSSTASSPVIDPPPTTDPNLASELKDPVATTKIKLEPEDAPSLPQVAKASSPEVVVKQEPLCSDDATKILREASQPVSAITRTTTTTSEQGLPGQIEAEVGAQDPHYFVIRVSDEVDFNDARKNVSFIQWALFQSFYCFCGVVSYADSCCPFLWSSFLERMAHKSDV